MGMVPKNHSEKGVKAREFTFAVISGTLKGKIITAPDLGITRPPLSRLRKAIFDFLNPYLQDARYLDLFSGTGSYLFEAVSRGAKKAVGVEIDKRLADAINLQARQFGLEQQLICLNQDVLKALAKMHTANERFDVILMAPPQYQGLIDATLTVLKSNPLSAPGGLIVCQHDTSETPKINFSNFEMTQQRKYGNTTFTILKSAGQQGNA
jgi:16S rRNA (guanine(966)-N(2))-methyltransferase RsmD